MTVNFPGRTIYPQNTLQQKQNETKNSGIGVAAGVGTYLLGKQFLALPTNGIMQNMKKINSSLSADESNLLSDSFEKAFKKSGLEEKGVRILRVNPLNVADTAASMTDAHYEQISKKIPQNLKNLEGFEDGVKIPLYQNVYKQLDTVAKGNNAFFQPKVNSILLPEKGTGLQLSSFHEMGHAINKNVSKIGKALQKLRPLQIIAPLGVMLVAMTTKEKANSAEGEGGARQFIKDNAGVLATMGWIPAIAEEALATKNGNSIAQKALSSAPELLKKVKKTNALGLATYVIMAAATGIATTLAVKAKDNIQAQKEQENK